MKKYNPYNSMKKIVDLKNSYDNEKRLNGNYKQYQDEAVQYYNDLINNGYVQQAADLSKYGYEDALNYLNNSGWKSDEETAFDEWYDNIGKVSADGTNEETELDKWVNNIGKVSTGDKSPISEQQSSYIDKLMGISSGKTSPANGQYSEWMNDLMGVSTGDKRPISDQQSDYIDRLMGIGTGETSPADGQYSNWLNDLMGISTGDKRPISEQQSSYINDLVGISKGSNSGGTTEQLSGWLDDMAALSTGKTSPQTSDAVSQLMEAWFGNNQAHTDRVNDYQQTGKNQLDYLNNFDLTKQSYFQPIMDSYKLQGSDAANGALASGASENAGNIDSYAAANANRQQLAFTNAAYQAALAAAQQNQTNWKDIYSLMGGNLADYGSTNAQNLGTIANMYGADAQERQNAANALYGVYNNAYNTDATERAKAMDVITQLFGQESAERQAAMNTLNNTYNADSLERQAANNVIRQLFGDESAERQAAMNTLNNTYSTDSLERQNANDVLRQLFGDESAERQNATNAMVDKYLADLGLVQTQYVTDADERMNTANNEHDLTVQKLANEYGLTVAQMESVLEDTKARLQHDSDLAKYDADKYSADKTYDAAKYKADMEKTLKELELQDTPAAEQSNTVTEAHANGVQELYSVLSEFINALRGGQYEDIQSVDDIRREIKNWSGYSTAYDPIIQSYLNGYERKFGTTT